MTCNHTDHWVWHDGRPAFCLKCGLWIHPLAAEKAITKTITGLLRDMEHQARLLLLLCEERKDDAA